MSDDPKYSICELSVPDTTFEEDLDLFSMAGATGIGLAEEKLREGDEGAQLEAFKASGLTATVCLPTNVAALPIQPALIYEGPADPQVRLSLMCDSIRRLAPFDPESVVVATGSDVGYSAEDARRTAVDSLREAADVAAGLGLRLAVEPCRRDTGFDASFVGGLPQTVALIDEIGRDNVGVCYDVYHHWDEADPIENAERYAGRIFGVQVNDWRQPPRGFADRLVPGDGIIDLPGIFSALERGGFDGWYDFEVFSDDGRWGTDLPDSLWKLPAEELVERGLTGMQAAMAKAAVA
ncbi:MAG TPA: sugar phosphate isomerase/epimerase family protein [Solirubrobacterales bacterium]